MSLIEKTEIKYITGYYKAIPGFPNKEDLIYLANKRAEDKKKDSTIITFTLNSLSKYLGPVDEDLLNSRIDELIEKEYIEVARETKTGKSYKILKNPYA